MSNDFEGKAVPEIPMATDEELDYFKAMTAQANEQGASMTIMWWTFAKLLNRLDAEMTFNTGIKVRRN